MLTKDLVQITARSGKLFPRLIQASDSHALADAREICEFFANVRGRTVGDIEDELKSMCSTVRRKALAKLVLDDCQMTEPDQTILDLRWAVFEMGEKMRRDTTLDADEFSKAVARSAGLSVAELRDKLFSDLPSFRKIDEVSSFDSESLRNWYNVSQVRTILLFATSATVKVNGCTVPQMRELMRHIKFNRLVGDFSVGSDQSELKINLTGPLSIFGSNAGYGLRLANFFSAVAALPTWDLLATIKWKGKELQLKIDHSCGLQVNQRRSSGAYIPKEFQQVIDVLTNEGDYKVSPGIEFVRLGGGEVCFPDFVICHGRRSIAVELFHGSHRAQLLQRVEAASLYGVDNLRIGVERSLLKDKGVADRLGKSDWFKDYGFEFRQFPTPTAIKKAVMKEA